MVYKEMIKENIEKAKESYREAEKLIDMLREVGEDISEYVPKMVELKDTIRAWEKVLEKGD
jgi:translation initiation factor 2B subunit (eIF-2B alpha/beta/delta family)